MKSEVKGTATSKRLGNTGLDDRGISPYSVDETDFFQIPKWVSCLW
jgi:hypothetical protein